MDLEQLLQKGASGCCCRFLRTRLRNSWGALPPVRTEDVRTTNPIESTFATVRLRTERTKGCGSRMATLTMVWQLARAAQKGWRRLNSSELLIKVIQRIIFIEERNKRRPENYFLLSPNACTLPTLNTRFDNTSVLGFGASYAARHGLELRIVRGLILWIVGDLRCDTQ